MKAPKDQSLKAQVEAAVRDELKRVGPDGFKRMNAARPFLGKGVNRATVFRWINSILGTGGPGQGMIREIRDAVEARATEPDAPAAPRPIEEVVADVAECLPVVARVEYVSTPTVNIISKLGEVVANMDLLIAHSKDKEGKVRNAKLLLAASDRLRACLETAMKVYQAMRDVQHVDRLHDAMITEIRKESPECAERILRAMDALAAEWVA